MNPQYYGAAAEYNKPSGGGFRINKRLFVMLGLIVAALLLIAVGFTIVTSLSKGPQEDFNALIARQSGLQDLMQKQQSTIRNGDLRKVNSESYILLLSDINALNSAYTTVFGADSIPEDGIPPEVDPNDETTLKSAVQNGAFDHTYVGMLRGKLASTYQQASKVAGALTDNTAKESLQKVMSNLEVIDDRLKALGL